MASTGSRPAVYAGAVKARNRQGADNAAAIRCYSKVGFKTVGIRRRSERGNDRTWHDGLLMDLLAEELIE